MRCIGRARVLVVTLLLLVGGGRAGRAQDPVEARVLVLDQGLRLPGVSRGARSLLHEDAVEARIVAGTWALPSAGEAVVAPDGTTKRWEAVTAAGTPPAFEGEGFTAGTYLSFRVPSATERVAILHARGHDFVYVNGELRPGDPYGYGWLRLPLLLRAGDLTEKLMQTAFGSLIEKYPDQVPDILAQLLPRASKLKIERLDSNANPTSDVPRPGTIILKVYEEDFEPVVVKLARARKIAIEVDRYEKFIARRVSRSLTAKLERHAELWDIGGALYSYIGDFDVVPFSQYYEDHDMDDIRGV